MSDMNATDSTKSDTAKPVKPKRLDRKSPLPTRGRKYEPLSRRGLLNPLVIDPACPWCGRSHVYRSAGLRIAACRGGYILITARKARGTAKASGVQTEAA
jgi:hypothetical protein